MANEKRLVDANVLIRDLTAMKSVYDAIALDGMIKALNEAPTVDAVEVVHGRWDEKTTPYWHLIHVCSICGFEKVTDHVFNYCPNCGARMDGWHEDG